MISGSTKNVTKSGPSEPVFITKILQKNKKIMESSLTNIMFVNMGIIFWNVLKVTCIFFEISSTSCLNHKNAHMKSQKSWIWISYLPKTMKWKFGKSDQLFYFQVRESAYLSKNMKCKFGKSYQLFLFK